MFYLLCLTLCLAVMFLVFATLSVATASLAGWLERALEKTSARTAANVLLFFRVLPFSLAVIVSVGLALPAFMEFEPPATKEIVNGPLIALAALGCFMLVLMAVRGVRMWRTTRFMQREWQRHAQPVSEIASRIPLFCIDTRASFLAVTGIFKPTVYVSRAVVDVLTAEELEAALSHEIAHVFSRDNLKQIAMKIVSPPLHLRGLQSTAEAWVRASEIAADESALAQGTSALELSSALIKVGRLSMNNAANIVPATVAASHLVPCGCGSATLTRAAHLRDLLEKGTVVTPAQSLDGKKILTVVAVMVAIYIVCLVTLLPAVHEALEFLVQ